MSYVEKDVSDRHEIIRIQSDDRRSGNPSNFVVYSGAHTFHGEYSLHRCTIPIAFYSVGSYNDTIYFNENSTNKTATIAHGFYSDATIAAAVKTAMDTASAAYNTFTVSVNLTNQKMTLTAGNAFSLKFGTNTTNSANEVMGFSAANTTAATSQTSDNIVDLSQTLHINIVINGISQQPSTGGNSCSFSIPITVQSLGVQTYESQHMQRIKFHSPTKTLSIQLLDDDNRTLDMNGVDWEMSLLRHTELVKA